MENQNDLINIGNLIHWEIKQKRVNKKDVAKELAINPINMSYYFKRPTLQADVIWRIGKYINYNFFMFLGEKMNIPYETKIEKALRAELAAKEREVADLQKERDLLMKVLGK